MSKQRTSRASRRQATCKQCKKVFRPKTNSKGIFCSQACKEDHYLGRAVLASPRPDEPVFIYALREVGTTLYRYIGVTVDLNRRLHDHVNLYKCEIVTHKTNWIRSVLRRGGSIEIIPLQELPGGIGWQDAERLWISRLREEGHPLTNSTSGGEGVPDLPPEARERIRQASIGRNPSAETRRKIGAASRGRRHTEEHKQKMRELMRARVFTPEHRQRISEAMSGKPKTKRKITAEQARDILARLALGELSKDLAKVYGVHPRTIWLIKSGRWSPALMRALKEYQ